MNNWKNKHDGRVIDTLSYNKLSTLEKKNWHQVEEAATHHFHPEHINDFTSNFLIALIVADAISSDDGNDNLNKVMDDDLNKSTNTELGGGSFGGGGASGW